MVDVQLELTFRSVGFYEGRKIKESGEKPSHQGDNQQRTKPMRRRVRESNPGYRRRRRALIHCANYAPQKPDNLLVLVTGCSILRDSPPCIYEAVALDIENCETETMCFIPLIVLGTNNGAEVVINLPTKLGNVPPCTSCWLPKSILYSGMQIRY